jgi:tripartite-type tricarboxylate transporter receptor subunit TctC
MPERLTRRNLLTGAAGWGVALSLCGGVARAASYPAQPINFIIPYGPGGTFDAYGRKFAILLQQGLGGAIVAPINAPGAAGKQAIFQLLQDAPDGYNISLVSVPGILMTSGSGPVDPTKLTWIANLGRDAYGLAVGPNSAIKSIADMKALGAKRPVVFASTGVGSTDYFATKVFSAALGIPVRMVSGYSDSPNTVIAVTRGDVDAVVHSLTTLKQLQASKLVRTLFVFQEKSSMTGVEDARSVGKPDLGEIFQWRPVAGPPGLPRDIVAKLSGILVAATKNPDTIGWASKLDTTLYGLGADQTRQMIATQNALIAKYRSVL